MKKTVFNFKPRTKNILFLGDPLGIQRFDKPKYPIFSDLARKQLQFIWMPERISLLEDRAKYRNLSDTEKFIFDTNLRVQTLIDSLLMRGLDLLKSNVTNEELENTLSVHSMVETSIHSFSYTHILRSLMEKNMSEFFDSILEDENITTRAKTIVDAYDSLFDAPDEDIKSNILNTIIQNYITEGVMFYTSFVTSFYFGSKLGFKAADIVKEIARDECVVEETEVLTPLGWKQISEINVGDTILQYNSDKTVSFTSVKKMVEHNINEEIVSMKTDKNTFDQMVTKNHRVIYVNSSGELKEKLAHDFKPNSKNFIPIAGKLMAENGESELTDLERFYIALQADGFITKDSHRNGKVSGTIPVTFTLSKPRKIDRLKNIINRLGWEYTEGKTKSAKTFSVKVPKDIQQYKTFEWVDLSNKDLSWCNEFIEEMVEWDGSRAYDGKYYYSSIIEKNRDMVQAIASLCGYYTNAYKQVDERKDSYSDVFRLTILKHKHKNKVSGQTVKKNYVNYKGRVFCPSVESGMFVMRLNGKVSITGNCLHVANFMNIFKILRDDPEEGFYDLINNDEFHQKVYTAFEIAVKSEKEWSKYIFSKGDLVGLNEETLNGYIEWIANNRLTSLGYKKIFNQRKNPLGSWINPFFGTDGEGNEVKLQVAPQESNTITSYKLNSINGDVTEDDYSSLQLD